MNQNDLRYFEAAFTVCIGNIEKGADRVDAIEEAVKTMGILVTNPEELREYLYSEVSFSSSDAASMLCSDERRGKDKEWWNKFKEKNGGSGNIGTDIKHIYPAQKSGVRKLLKKA